VNRLEQRYRLVLRTLLPASYRKLWEEDMVATFLESMDSDDAEAAEFLADYGRPGWSEVASVAALAVRLRLGAAEAPLRSATGLLACTAESPRSTGPFGECGTHGDLVAVGRQR
jgi:hypothetical protein